MLSMHCSIWYPSVKSMEIATGQVVDATTFRRLLFATSYLPPDIPNSWDIIATFANQGNSGSPSVSPESAKLAMENVQVLSTKAFLPDVDLTKELIAMEYGPNKQTLGVPLVPVQAKCLLCGGKLLLRSDRPSRMTLYTESLGTVIATHFHKYCCNYRKGCTFVQFYGYYKCGSRNLHYSDKWMDLPYFLSSQETGFEMTMLKQFDTELLIGQISYKQKADIYNVSRGYDTTKKVCTTIERSSEARLLPVHGYAMING